jgi:curved DNA-binding protein CbpA
MDLESANRQRALAWSDVIDQATYYEILGVDPWADEQTIKDAFHQFVVAFHTDRHLPTDRGPVGAYAAADEEFYSSLRRVFQRGTEAYRVLRDPELRLRYDAGLAKGRLRLPKEQIPSLPNTSSQPGQRLDELARSGGAKLCAQKADKLLGLGDLTGALRELERALQYDGNANSGLSERIEALEIALYAMGDD